MPTTPLAVVAASPVAHAAACTDYHCGHISRSSSRAVKRAAFLYACEARDLGSMVRASEAPEVLTALALMRAGAECREIVAAAMDNMSTLDEAAAPLAPLYRPEDLGPEVLAVLALVTEGWSYPEIAAEQGIAKETVRSHVKRAMRLTLTHTATDAAVALVEEGLL